MPAAQCDPAAALRRLAGCRLSPVKKYRKKRNAKQIKVSGSEFAQWPLQLPVSVREVSVSKVHKQPLWCWLTCQRLPVGAWGQNCHPTPATSPLLEPGLQDSVPSPGHKRSVGPWRTAARGWSRCRPNGGKGGCLGGDTLVSLPAAPGSGTLALSCILCGSISWKALA